MLSCLPFLVTYQSYHIWVSFLRFGNREVCLRSLRSIFLGCVSGYVSRLSPHMQIALWIFLDVELFGQYALAPEVSRAT